jgi:hypothetical protein
MLIALDPFRFVSPQYQQQRLRAQLKADASPPDEAAHAVDAERLGALADNGKAANKVLTDRSDSMHRVLAEFGDATLEERPPLNTHHHRHQAALADLILTDHNVAMNNGAFILKNSDFGRRFAQRWFDINKSPEAARLPFTDNGSFLEARQMCDDNKGGS